MRHLPACLTLLVLLPCAAQAAVPTTMLIEGQLVAASGQYVPDGKYAVTFKLYDAPSAGNVLWQEGPEDVVVAGGLFSQAIGQKTALTGDKLAASGAWLSLQVATDAELPRQPLASVPYALRAQLAEGLACTGCVTAAMLDGGVLTPYATVQSLSQYALQTALASYVTGSQLTTELVNYAQKSTLSNVAFSGQYADLLGLPTVAGLPPNGLSTVSNDLLTNVFTTLTGHATLELPIKDCYGLGVTDTVTIPDLGIAQDLTVDVSLTNSDISGVTVLLIDPTGQPHTLYDKAGTGTGLAKTYSKTDAGLTGWIGKNPKGDWQLKVVDSLCGPGGADGAIHGWGITVQALSAKQVQANGDLVVSNLIGTNGLLNVQGAVTFAGAVSFQGTPIARVYTASADALADGASLDLVTGGSDPLSAASGWVQNGSGWSLIPGDAGTTCSLCGDGGEGDFAITSDASLIGNNHQFSNLTIGAGATLTPKTTDPLIVRVNGTVTIDGSLMLDGGNATYGYYTGGMAGPGGGAQGGQGSWGTGDGGPGSGPAGGDAGKGGGTGYNAGNGGGGGHAVAGGTSGLSAGGSVFGSSALASGLEGGSAGGGGGGAGSSATCSSGGSGGGGGGGGGAALIIAKQIVISVTGKVSATGGAGGLGKCAYAGAGGGGSGGTIWLRANSVAVDGTLSVAGGVLTGTASGSPGRIRIDGALTGAWVPPAIADLATKGSFYQGSGVAPNPPYTLSQPTPGTVRITNHSGAAQNIRLVVLR